MDDIDKEIICNCGKTVLRGCPLLPEKCESCGWEFWPDPKPAIRRVLEKFKAEHDPTILVSALELALVYFDRVDRRERLLAEEMGKFGEAMGDLGAKLGVKRSQKP